MKGQKEILSKIYWWILFKKWGVSAILRCRAKRAHYEWRLCKRKKNCPLNKNKNRWKKKSKKKELRWKIAAKNKELKRIKKTKKYKEDEKELCSRLKELNENFARIKEHKKIIKRKKFFGNLNICFYHTYVWK